MSPKRPQERNHEIINALREAAPGYQPRYHTAVVAGRVIQVPRDKARVTSDGALTISTVDGN